MPRTPRCLALCKDPIDFKKAFDSITCNPMFKVLRHYGIPETLIEAVSQENQDDPFLKNTRKPYNYNSVLFDFYGEFS